MQCTLNLKKLLLAVLCASSSLPAGAQALKIGATKAQVEKALGAKLEEDPISSFSKTFQASDAKALKNELPESLRNTEIRWAVFSFDRSGKLWRVHVTGVEQPADDAFAAYEATSDVLSKKYGVAPKRKGIGHPLPVLEECTDYRGRGSAVSAGFKKKWDALTKPQREAFTMACGGGSAPFLFAQHKDKNDVAEVVSFERIGVYFGAGDPEKRVEEFLAEPARAAVVYLLIQTSQETPRFTDAEAARAGL